MKTIGAALQTHLAGNTLSVCQLWKMTRRDGQIFGFTSNSRDIVYLGVTYSSLLGHAPSTIKTTSGMNVDTLSVTSFLSSTTVSEEDIRAGIWDFASFEIMVVNYLDLTMGHYVLRAGTIGNVTNIRYGYTTELRGMFQSLQQVVGRVCNPGCDATLGDTRCGVNLASFTVTGTVTSVTSSQVFTDTSIAAAAAYYDGGVITWTSGLNDTYAAEVKSSATGGIITLQQGMPNAVQIGDTYSLVAGCTKAIEVCKAKFNNVVRFRGFPHVPGGNALTAGI